VSAGLILAAGGSRRFEGDGPKLLAPFRGRPLISWALEHAGDAGFDEIIVVTGPVNFSSLVNSQIVVKNPRWQSGLATSLQVGVGEARRRGHQAVVVGLGDQPHVPASAWRAVAASSSPIAVGRDWGPPWGGPCSAAHRAPPVRLSREVWSLLPATGDSGARDVVRERPDLVTEIPCDGDALDIDTLEDLTVWG
jgi:nicotine blue oxidoreductase